MKNKKYIFGNINKKINTSKNQKGISLLEVLAALVILSMGSSVAFTWFNQNVAMLNRLKQEEKILLTKIEAIEYIKSINPVKNFKGNKEISGFLLTWQSVQKAPPRRALNNRGGEGRFEVSLYEVEVTISDNIDKHVYEKFKINLSGYSEVSGSGIAW